MAMVLFATALYAVAAWLELPRLLRYRDWSAITGFAALSLLGIGALIASGLQLLPEAVLMPVIDAGHAILHKLGLGVPPG
ncbi:MAG: hypothetical protein IMX01_00130 [Limnochordaceae bacterium]|nr:hypothetical protein [Limnochordaceae bacterium]